MRKWEAEMMMLNWMIYFILVIYFDDWSVLRIGLQDRPAGESTSVDLNFTREKRWIFYSTLFSKVSLLIVCLFYLQYPRSISSIFRILSVLIIVLYFNVKFIKLIKLKRRSNKFTLYEFFLLFIHCNIS